MIPRLHKRGTSFKGVCRYILHDAGKVTNDRVLWSEAINMVSTPEHAWFEMYATARDQAALKLQAGNDARGRKNTKPVLHYTLSWAVTDNPSPEHMRETALSSLKALKLDEHQALMAAHSDKDHMHVHIVVNTVHPETGMTAPLKYTKEALSKWAEAYEKQHGIHLDQRIKNNQLRDDIRLAKQAVERLRELGDETSSFVAVKHKADQRADWLDRNKIIDRMKALRKEIEPILPPTTGISQTDLWKRQLLERDILDQNTAGAVDHARTAVFERYRPQWRELYRVQKKEMRHLDQQATHIFERAVFVFQNRERLAGGKEFGFRQMVALIRSPDRLRKRVEAIQQKERTTLGRAEKVEKRVVSKKLWDQHKTKFNALREKQAVERKGARSEREEQLRFIVTYDLARETLRAEHEAAMSAEKSVPHVAAPGPQAAEAFNTSVNTRSPMQMARVEAIKKQMEEWRRQNPSRDFGREM
jgi:hypothetical protein